MRRAVAALTIPPDYLLIDAMRIDWPCEQLPLIDGDARCRAIAAASLIAKVHRDACLAAWDRVFPQFNLASNKGYATPDHRRALHAYIGRATSCLKTPRASCSIRPKWLGSSNRELLREYALRGAAAGKTG